MNDSINHACHIYKGQVLHVWWSHKCSLEDLLQVASFFSGTKETLDYRKTLVWKNCVCCIRCNGNGLSGQNQPPFWFMLMDLVRFLHNQIKRLGASLIRLCISLTILAVCISLHTIFDFLNAS